MDLHPLPDVNEKSNTCPQVFANLWSPILYFSFDFYSDTNQDLPPFHSPAFSFLLRSTTSKFSFIFYFLMQNN